MFFVTFTYFFPIGTRGIWPQANLGVWESGTRRIHCPRNKFQVNISITSNFSFCKNPEQKRKGFWVGSVLVWGLGFF